MDKQNSTGHAARIRARRLAACTIPAAVSAILMQAQVARAEEAGDALEEVVVTGFRHSIEASVATKRQSESIVESITAEDIGKLPDLSIAESIARLPGLAGQRVNGRTSEISLRGLGPDFAVTLLNGRELVSTGNNRGVEYDQYPSELISAVTVYKTPDASLGAQGLSGTVNLQTIRPLDEKEGILVVNGRYERNSNGALNSGVSGNGNRFSASWTGKFMDNRLGLALNYAHLDSPEQEQHFGAWWWDRGNVPDPTDPTGCGVNCDVISMLGSEVIATSAKQKRDAVMGVLDMQVTDNLRSTVDLYFSQYDVEQTARGLLWESAGLAWGDTTSYTSTNIQTDPRTGERMLVGGTMAGVQPVEQSNFNKRKDQLLAVGWNNQLTLDRWKLSSDLSYSKVKRREQTYEMYAGLGDASLPVLDNNFGFSIPIGNSLAYFTPGKNYADPASIFLADPGGWGQDGFMRQPHVDDRLATLRLDASRSLDGWISSANFGVSYSDRAKTRADHDYQFKLHNGGAAVSIDPSLLLPATSLSWTGIPGVLAYDIMGAMQRYMDPPVKDLTQPWDWKRNYTISEKIALAYVKFGIHGDLGPVPVVGNVGLQYVRADQSADGIDYQAFPNPADPTTDLFHVIPVNDGTTYSNVLPSLNLNFDLGKLSPDLHVRFGAARTMARPRMDDLKAGTDAGVGRNPKEWGGSAGNPQLRPWIADSLDLSFEKYFGKRSYAAVAPFYKKIKTFIYNQTRVFDFAGLPNQSGLVPDPQFGTIGNLDQPINGKGGFVKGVEVSLSLDAGLLWDKLDGFGMMGSYTANKSNINPDPNNNPGVTLPGLSPVMGNLTFYYEQKGFSTRVSRRTRAAFRAESLGPHGDRIATEIRSEAIVDFQIGYEFQAGPAKGLSILGQVDNLTDTPYRTRIVNGFGTNLDAPETYNTYGRQVFFGLNYKFR